MEQVRLGGHGRILWEWSHEGKERASHGKIWVHSIPGRGKSKYKGLEYSKAFHIQRTKRPFNENIQES